MPGRLFVANRGEIAVRIVRTATDLGWTTVAARVGNDTNPTLDALADQTIDLAEGSYLDGHVLVRAATTAEATHVHPGYGFLSESADFAQTVIDAGLGWVGPRPAVLSRFGDKSEARRVAVGLGVPVAAGTDGPTSLEEAAAFLARHGPIMVKAVAGGGGRGMRPATTRAELEAAWDQCRAEADGAFGNPDLYVEALIVGARHIEVQIAGDGRGEVAVLGDRDCSVQRRRQKLIEIAPAQQLPETQRAEVHQHARRLAAEVDFDGVGTVEFLVSDRAVRFIEANARLQVEHTVTEAVTGVDLVALQLHVAEHHALPPLDSTPRGVAIQARVNAETLDADGTVRPSVGTADAPRLPAGPGVRVDTAVSAGWSPNLRYDSLAAKVIAHGADFDSARTRLARALGELDLGEVATTAPLLRVVTDRLREPVDTTWLGDHLAELVEAAPRPAVAARPVDAAVVDGLAVIAPITGTVSALVAEVGDTVAQGAAIAVLEAMKMEHLIVAPVAGTLTTTLIAVGEVVVEGQHLATLLPSNDADHRVDETTAVDLSHVRPDLAEVLARHEVVLDTAPTRHDAVGKRHGRGHRTARENVADLVDPGSFVEYGPLVIAAQRRRRALQDLIERTPADGLVGGLATVNGHRTLVATYDYMVLAGTQGLQNHRKKDRLFELAERHRLPVVLFTEGGGGRPGDTDGTGVSGLDCLAFALFAKLHGHVPLVGVVNGRCFAGNAALLGCCDVVIATRGSSIGMGGPAMIEGGGLGIVDPDDVGPTDVHVRNGVIDVLVEDEAEAVDVARRYLSYFQGASADWEVADQRALRHLIPEQRRRIYDVRAVIDSLFDTGSVLELRRGYGPGMITALARVEGHPLGVVSNDPAHLAGAIDAEGAQKAARFLDLCNAHGLPVLFLCDTPGIMVGPEAEATGLVRHAAGMFTAGAALTVPFGTIVLRKGYGLGAQAMAGGSFKAPVFCISWPTGEFGGMGLEGAVRLGYRNELAAITDDAERTRVYDEMVARMYEHGKAINTASHFEIDDVIDPAESRRWITSALLGV